MRVTIAISVPDHVIDDWDWTLDEIADHLRAPLRNALIDAVITTRAIKGVADVPTIERPPF